MPVLSTTKFDFFKAQITFHSGYSLPEIVSPSWQHSLLGVKLRDIEGNNFLGRFSDKYFEILKHWQHSRSSVIDL